MSQSLQSLLRRARGMRPVSLPPVDGVVSSIPPSEVERGMRLGVAEGALSQVHLSLTFGTLGTGPALLLGASSFELGLLAAMPVIGRLLQIPAAWWIERSGDRKRMAVLGSLVRFRRRPDQPADGAGSGRGPQRLLRRLLPRHGCSLYVGVVGRRWTDARNRRGAGRARREVLPPYLAFFVFSGLLRLAAFLLGRKAL